MITLAVPKGRVQDEAIALFAKAGIDLSPIQDGSRRLVFELPAAELRVLVVRDADVPTYVEHGAADVGIAGRDVLEERGSDLYEPLDLKIGACRLAVAEPLDPPARAVDDEGRGAHLRYCTKFPNLTRRHLEATGTVADVIKLSGSVELGPLTGLCDRIVDLVSSGETLRQHRLREVETILDVSSRLVVNRAAWKVRRRPIDALLARLGGVV
ncbi:MAG TPA: ATP phosphoribosyltransferase [Polyangia bacterium]|nr:ATP phosphoribosyltransferase [Polyangia bacterium]